MSQTGWPSISSSVYYEDAAAAIDWLCRALGFEVRLRVEGEAGEIVHSELTFGDGVIMVGGTGAKNRGFCASPRSTGGANTQVMCLLTDDVDRLCERARAAGAAVEIEPATQDYGDEYDSHRTCLIADLDGHRWWLMQLVRPARGK